MSPWTHAVGWTLIHFVWQGAALAVIAAGTLRLCRRRAANTRYVVACIGLGAMLVSPAITALLLTRPDLTAAPAVGVTPTITAPVIASTGPRS